MRLGCISMVLQYLTGKEDHYMCVECIRMVLQYLTGYEDHYRRV